jgi:D-alanyl-D-alanine carboxypeptidase
MRTGGRYLVAVVCVLLSVAPPAFAQTASPVATAKPGSAPGITAASAILVNFSDDNQVLYTRAPRAVRAPASLTKVVTALVARDEYDLEEVVVSSPLVAQTGGSDLNLEPGDRITVRELLYALLLKSANDAGMALAAHHPGGYEHFVRLMNEKARSLGAVDSVFRNPHGLDQIGHVSSARDMAIFTRELLRDPVLAAIAGTRTRRTIIAGRQRLYDHHHRLLLRNDSIVLGKTAFTNNAGHALMTVADTPAGRLIAVVMGSGNQYGDTLSLIEYGKIASARQAAGGGSVEGYGQLLPPPLPPDTEFASAPGPRTDPRDDVRWSILMIICALATAYLLITRRRTDTAPSTVNAWLASLQAEERERR